MRKTSLVFVLIMFSIAVAQADSLTGSKFLKLSKDQRNWWYSGAYMAIGHLVYLHDKKKAQCVWNWLLVEPARKQSILKKSLKKYPEQSPTNIVIALLERDCGALLPQVTSPLK